MRTTTTKKPKGLETKAGAVVAKDGSQSTLPAYLQGEKPAALSGAMDADDIILPRIKLLQGISPEVEAFEDAKNGVFWHSVLGERIRSEMFPDGDGFDFIVLTQKKKYLLMAPLTDPRGVLARAEDGVHWKPANQSFEVKLKGVKEPQTWTTKDTVRESGLAEFGSSVKGDDDSKPAAVLIYEYLVYLPDRPDISPIFLSLARSQARKGKDLNSKIVFRNAPLESQRFRATVIEETGDEGPYKNYQFQNAGWATQDEYRHCKALAEQFGTARAADEEGLVHEAEPATGEDPKDY